MERSLLSKEGDKILLSADPGGILITVIPRVPPFEVGVQDVFSGGLQFSSLAKLLRDLRNGTTFTTGDGFMQCFMGKDEIVLQFRPSHDSELCFFSTCDQDVTQQIIHFIEGALSGKIHADLPDLLDSPMPRVSRNEPCPCGSGKKYKKCCLQSEMKKTRSPLLDQITEHVSDVVVQELRMAATLNPSITKDASFWNELGQALGTIEEHKKSLRAFQIACQLEPLNFVFLLNQAVAIHSLGRSDDALAILDRIPRDHPRKAVINANILKSLGRHNEAIDLYEQAIDEEPNFDLPYVNLVSSLRETHNPLLEHWLRRAIAAVPNSPDLAFIWSELLFTERRYQELAEADWIDGLESRAGDLSLMGRAKADPQLIVFAQLTRACARLILYHSRDSLYEALRLDEAYGELDDSCGLRKTILGIACELGDYGTVEQLYLRLCPVCRADLPGGLHHLLALTAAENKDWEKVVHYESAELEQAPNNPRALHNYWWALDELERTEEALEAAHRLYKVNPAEQHLAFNLGFLAGKANCFGEAAWFYEEELRRNPYHLYAQENLAVILVLLRRIPQAQACFSEWLEKVSKWLQQGRPGLWYEDWPSDLILEKKDSFNDIVEFSKNASPEAYLIEVNKKLACLNPALGLSVTIRPRMLLSDEIIEMLRTKEEYQRAEALARLESQAIGDYSAIIASLKTIIPDWELLPVDARRSLTEAERRFQMAREGQDCSTEVVGFAKAVEITLKAQVFDEYKKRGLDTINVASEVELTFKDPRFKQVQTFARYIEKGPFIELGGMLHTFRLCVGKTAEKNLLLGHFRDFITTTLKKTAVLQSEVAVALEELIQLRNPAAHTEVLPLQAAAQARMHSFFVLTQLRSAD